MLFNSLTFVVFLAVVVLLHNLPVGWRQKKLQLLVASYLFYAAWNPPFVAVLWFSTAVDWWVAGALHRTRGAGRRKALLLVSLVANLGLLGFFKYGGFVLENFVALTGAIGLHYRPVAPDIVLPVGISFYTFQTLSYTIDVYRRQLAPAPSFLDFALFVTFFPQLVAGPIVRASDFLPQCVEPRRATRARFGWGLFLVSLGLFEKVVLADVVLAPVADLVFGSPFPVGMLDAWVGVLAFGSQIFCDFAGYSTCAIGLAFMLGFWIPDNFRYPYGAVGFSDFWRRWHVSLSTWLRDYLYIPLGGNRGGSFATYRNVLITMLLGGLWHGASWTFVAWGGLHGLFLVVERALRARFGGRSWTARWPVVLAGGAVTFVLVHVAWVFFRAQSFGQALLVLGTMAGFVRGFPVVRTLDLALVGGVVAGIVLVHALMRRRHLAEVAGRLPWWLLGVVWAFFLLGLALTQGGGNAFIYFQF